MVEPVGGVVLPFAQAAAADAYLPKVLGPDKISTKNPTEAGVGVGVGVGQQSPTTIDPVIRLPDGLIVLNVP